MVDAWGAVRTRRTFEEHEGIILVAVIQTLLEGVVFFPILADGIGCLSEIQLFIFLVVVFHKTLYSYFKAQKYEFFCILLWI